jgi:uncharacterized protein (TIGR02996 family)
MTGLAMKEMSREPKLSVKEAMTFVRAIHAGEFDTALVFADWIEEGGYPRHALLLRRRWQRWKRERTKAEHKSDVFRKAIHRLRGTTPTQYPGPAYRVSDVDMCFRRYIQKHFPLPEFNDL